MPTVKICALMDGYAHAKLSSVDTKCVDKRMKIYSIVINVRDVMSDASLSNTVDKYAALERVAV